MRFPFFATNRYFDNVVELSTTNSKVLFDDVAKLKRQQIDFENNVAERLHKQELALQDYVKNMLAKHSEAFEHKPTKRRVEKHGRNKRK